MADANPPRLEQAAIDATAEKTSRPLGGKTAAASGGAGPRATGGGRSFRLQPVAVEVRVGGGHAEMHAADRDENQTGLVGDTRPREASWGEL